MPIAWLYRWALTAAAHEQVAVGLLVLDQPLQPSAHGVLVAALDVVDVAGAQQREQGQAGRRGVRVDARLRRARVGLALLLEVQGPGAVGPLVPTIQSSRPPRPSRNGPSPPRGGRARRGRALPARKWGRDLIRELRETRPTDRRCRDVGDQLEPAERARPARPARVRITRPGIDGCAAELHLGVGRLSPSEGGSRLCSFVNGSPDWFASTSEVSVADLPRQELAVERSPERPASGRRGSGRRASAATTRAAGRSGPTTGPSEGCRDRSRGPRRGTACARVVRSTGRRAVVRP